MTEIIEWLGEEQNWEALGGMDPSDVEKRTGAIFDHASSAYVLECLGQDIRVNLKTQQITSDSRYGSVLTEDLREFSWLPFLHYLVHAQDVPPSENFVNPSTLPGGQIFVQGAHVLPLPQVAAQFDGKRDAFLERVAQLAGTPVDHGDVAALFLPFPRTPVMFIVWFGDDEFPAESSLLVDSGCTTHLSPDVVWAMAMMTVEMIALKEPN